MSNIINYFGNAGLKHNKNKTEVVNHNLRNTPLQVLGMLGIQIDTHLRGTLTDFSLT